MGGMIANKVIKTTKRNDIMAFLDLEDLYGLSQLILYISFPLFVCDEAII